MRRVLHCLVEVVHVQLPHEGLEVAVFEVLRQDLASELSDSVDDNSVASRTPSAKGSVAIAIENFKAFLIFFFFSHDENKHSVQEKTLRTQEPVQRDVAVG